VAERGADAVDGVSLEAESTWAYAHRPPGGKALTVVNVKVTYDRKANAAYIYFTDPEVVMPVARMYPCDPVEVDGMINVDFDAHDRLVGVEVLAASSKLPKYLLDSAERLDVEGG
jgi:uncharacterized protein YuzE